jgi:MYXO-CTERM domain-containing protein
VGHDPPSHAVTAAGGGRAARGARAPADRAGTVDALQHKLDVKAQAKHKAADLRDRSTTATGKPRPELIGGVLAVAVLVGLAVWRRRR